ncbi:MAG: hypothetical protein HN627_05110 [Opitutae bacterium]|nr:hypothetical protein [Opitutae bacterium]
MGNNHPGRHSSGGRRGGGKFGFEHSRDSIRSPARRSGGHAGDQPVSGDRLRVAGLRRRLLRLVPEKEPVKAVSAEDEIGKVAGLCVKALLEFLGHLVELLYRLATALIGKIRAFLERTREARNNKNQLKEKEKY